MSRDQDPIDGRKVIFEKCRIEPEMDETMGVYEASHFREIFPEEKLEEYIGELKEIWNKKGIDNRVYDGGDCSFRKWKSQ